jgi:hypothetical protein
VFSSLVLQVSLSSPQFILCFGIIDHVFIILFWLFMQDLWSHYVFSYDFHYFKLWVCFKMLSLFCFVLFWSSSTKGFRSDHVMIDWFWWPFVFVYCCFVDLEFVYQWSIFWLLDLDSYIAVNRLIYLCIFVCFLNWFHQTLATPFVEWGFVVCVANLMCVW